MKAKKGNISIGVALSGNEGIETKEKKKESIAERNEREEKEAERIEDNISSGFKAIFPEEEKEKVNPFKPSFGAAFRKERELLIKQK